MSQEVVVPEVFETKRDPLVNYDELEKFEKIVREEFPDAYMIKAFPNRDDEIYVEVRMQPLGAQGETHARLFEGSPYKRRGRRNR